MAADPSKKDTAQQSPPAAETGSRPRGRGFEDAESAHLAAEIADHAESLLHNITRQAAMCPEGQEVANFLNLPLKGLTTLEQGGVIFYRQQDFRRARAMFRLVLGLSTLLGQPRSSALRGLAACDHSQNALPEAIALYRQALALDPDDEISIAALANCLALVGDDSWSSRPSVMQRRRNN